MILCYNKKQKNKAPSSRGLGRVVLSHQAGVRIPLGLLRNDIGDLKGARVMKLRQEGVVNERVADRSEAEAPNPLGATRKRGYYGT